MFGLLWEWVSAAIIGSKTTSARYMPKASIPGAAQRETVRCRPGTPILGNKLDPGSAAHFATLALHRVRGPSYGYRAPETRKLVPLT